MKKLTIPIISVALLLLAGCAEGMAASHDSNSGGVVRADDDARISGKQGSPQSAGNGATQSGDDNCDCGDTR